MMVSIKVADSDQEILSCFDVMSQLHDKLSRDEFVDYIARLKSKGYQLAFLEDGERVRSIMWPTNMMGLEALRFGKRS